MRNRKKIDSKWHFFCRLYGVEEPERKQFLCYLISSPKHDVDEMTIKQLEACYIAFSMDNVMIDPT